MAGLGSRLRPEMPRTLAPGWGGRKFRAFDKATGAILWETELPSGVTGAPTTYMFDGKQYIAAAIGNTEEERAGFVALSSRETGLSNSGRDIHDSLPDTLSSGRGTS